jgi:hypothetical protein
MRRGQRLCIANYLRETENVVMSKSAIVLDHYEGWKMPEEMEAYTKAFAQADHAAKRLAYLVSLIESVAESLKDREAIAAATIPDEWPTAGDLKGAIQDIIILKQKVYLLWKAISPDKQKMLTGPARIGR